MTTEEWKEVENELLVYGYPVKLKIDGYNIYLKSIRENMTLCIALLVDGKFEREWIQEDCDIRRRFMCQSKRCLVKQKEIEKVTRSKKRQQEIKANNMFISYSPYWSSFKRLKSHLIKNNTSIELVEGI